MSDNISILFFTSSLGGGGAEKNLLRVINHLDRRIFHPQLALARAGGAYEPELACDVPVHHFNRIERTNSSTLQMLGSIRPLRRLIKRLQPDIVCSVLDHANIITLLATWRLRKCPKLVLTIQNTPSYSYLHSKHIIKRLLFISMPQLYQNANRIIVLSQGVADDVTTLFPRLSESLQVIYNSGFDDSIAPLITEPTPERDVIPYQPVIVACGRLTKQKGFPYLIQALSQIRQEIPAHLWIIGEGEQRKNLEQMIQNLNLSGFVKLLSWQSNPYKYMASADVFVLSSLWEGFGNVIVEAMSCGTPVVATDCNYGPAEIITNEVNGLLVPPGDANALSKAIIRVLKDKPFSKRLATNGKLRAQDFSASKIAMDYQKLFIDTLHTVPAR